MPIKNLTILFNKNFLLKKSESAIYQRCLSLGLSKYYSDEMIEFLRKNFDGITRDELVMKFNKHFNLKKNSEQIKNLCIRNNIYMKYKNQYINKKGVAFSRINGRYIPKKKYIYENEHGVIEEDETIISIDGNKQNFSLENLRKVKKEEARLLGIYKIRLTNDTIETALLFVKLRLKVIQLEKA